MIRVAMKLVVIFALVTAGVHVGYRRLEQELLRRSCVPSPAGNRTSASAKAAEPGRPQETPPSAASVAQNFQIIVQRNIFQVGLKPTVEKPPEPPVKEVVPTALNLTLAGTVTGNERTARAIIVDNAGKDRKQQLLQIGDGVQGAIIKAITWNSVTLDVNGTLEVLSMPKPKDIPGFSGPAGTDHAMPAPNFAPNVGAESPGIRRGPPVRPNRRINLPSPQEPEMPVEVTEEAPPVIDEMPMSEPSQIEEPPLPEPAEIQMPPEPEPQLPPIE